jgi:uroporphyrinogen-III decarboxylase
MASSGAQSIAVDECMTLSEVGEIAVAHTIGFLGNLHVSTVLFDESQEAASDVQRCLEQGGRFPGYVFGLGGPIVQRIDTSRLESALAVYRARRQRQ